MTSAARSDQLVSFTVPPEVFDALDQLASRYGISIPDLVRTVAGNMATLANIIPKARP